MLCEICEAEEAAFTIIPTGEGMPQSLGPACFARAGLGLAKEILDPEEIASTLGPMFVKPAAEQAAGRVSKRKPVRQAETAPEPAAETGEAGRSDEEPAAAANE